MHRGFYRRGAICGCTRLRTPRQAPDRMLHSLLGKMAMILLIAAPCNPEARIASTGSGASAFASRKCASCLRLIVDLEGSR